MLAALVVALGAAGCGVTVGPGEGSPKPPPEQAVVIVTQPASQTVPLGSAVTFSVAASGTGPLHYQWTENGSALGGATAATYTIPATTQADGGAAFQVTVSNSISDAVSQTATLTLGPRAPKPGDIRYLQWQQVPPPYLGNPTGFSELGNNGKVFTSDNMVGTPLDIGGNCSSSPQIDICSWFYDVLPLLPPQTGLNMKYTGSTYQTFAADLQSLAAPNLVVQSLDLEPAYYSYGLAAIQTERATGFDLRVETVAPGALQAAAATDAAASRILTAVSFNAQGEAEVLSYGWQGDPSTVYEAQTYITPAEGVANAAVELANAGYTISAFGGNAVQGWMLCGFRVKGDSLPRPLSVDQGNVTTQYNAENKTGAYTTPVVFLNDPSIGTLIVDEW